MVGAGRWIWRTDRPVHYRGQLRAKQNVWFRRRGLFLAALYILWMVLRVLINIYVGILCVIFEDNDTMIAYRKLICFPQGREFLLL